MAAYVGVSFAYKNNSISYTAITMILPSGTGIDELKGQFMSWAKERWPENEGWTDHSIQITKEISLSEAKELVLYANDRISTPIDLTSHI